MKRESGSENEYVYAKADGREHSRGYFRMIVGFIA